MGESSGAPASAVVNPKIECAHDAIVELHKLVPHPRNPNKHGARQIEILAKIIDHQGQRHPIVVSNQTGFIVAGHGRLMALQRLAWPACAVDYQDFKSPADEYAFIVADNKIAELAEHDDAMMIEDIKAFEFEDFELLGLDDFTLPVDPDAAKDAIEDEIPGSAETRCKPGDIWILGDHRLMCGDSTNIQHVERLMNGEKADMVFTSPPYNCGSSPKSHAHAHALENCGFTLRRQIIWRKSGAQIPLWQNTKKNPVARNYLPNYTHENIFYSSKGELEKGQKTEHSDELANDVWEISQFSAGGNNHPAAFPVKLVELPIMSMTNESETLFEPFSGSGSTLIACEKTKRRCFGMEIDPYYCDVILSRWEKYSGKTAKLSGENPQNGIEAS